MSDNDPMRWRMRHAIYRGFAETGRPPLLEALAADLGIPIASALSLLHEVDSLHSVFLTEDRRGVLMANPFSAEPTPFQVTANGVEYWANCAWDMFGVSAALDTDATIRGPYAVDGAPAALRVDGGIVTGSDGIVHFLQPFRTWYDDLRHT
jgi:hypothetical protein